MEIVTMGKVVVPARIENQSDLIKVAEGNLAHRKSSELGRIRCPGRYRRHFAVASAAIYQAVRSNPPSHSNSPDSGGHSLFWSIRTRTTDYPKTRLLRRSGRDTRRMPCADRPNPFGAFRFCRRFRRSKTHRQPRPRRRTNDRYVLTFTTSDFSSLHPSVAAWLIFRNSSVVFMEQNFGPHMLQ